MNAGRGRLEIGTYGDINTSRSAAGTIRAEARYRDWDGEIRKVTATGDTERAAKQALRATQPAQHQHRLRRLPHPRQHRGRTGIGVA